MPILSETSLEFLSHSPEQTIRFGVRLGELLRPGHVICLEGDLGSGKTTFAQGIARGWGSIDQATSPTFVLLNQYRRADSNRLYHFDAFRLRSAMEAISIGLQEVLEDNGPIILEWPEKIRDIIPEERLWVRLRWVDEFRRAFYFEPLGPRYERLIREYRKVVFGG